MSYSALDDLKKKIDESRLIQLTDTTNAGVIDAVKVDRAIRDADAVIDSYTSKVYKTPMSPVPDLVAELSSTIAIMHLHRFRSVESPPWKAAYDSALAILGKISTGSVTLKGAIAEPAPSENSASSNFFSSSERQFSRDLLKEM